MIGSTLRIGGTGEACARAIEKTMVAVKNDIMDRGSSSAEATKRAICVVCLISPTRRYLRWPSF